MKETEIPGFWMDEASGVLRPAFEAYLNGKTMTADQITAMRGYLRQCIMAPHWKGSQLPYLRRQIDGLNSVRRIRRWIAFATQEGMDPL